MQRSVLELPLSKLCAVPFALQNRALFTGEKRARKGREEGRKRDGQQRGKKEKRTGQYRALQAQNPEKGRKESKLERSGDEDPESP